MNALIEYLWLVPALPLLAAGLSALVKRPSHTALIIAAWRHYTTTNVDHFNSMTG